jgi:hypothetical protein
MRKIRIVVAMLVLLSSFAVSQVHAFSCGTRLVEIGNTRYDVISKCGSPDWKDSWEEERIERVWGYSYTTKGLTRVPVATIVHVTIEEWVYNLGPTKFVRILRFENNRLVDVDSGGYGS